MNVKIQWGRIAIFYVIAFTVSGLFNSGFLTPLYQKLTHGWLIGKWTFLPAGIGTLMAACIAFQLDREHHKTITLLGNDPIKNIATAIVPVVVFTIIGLATDTSINKNGYALVFSIIALLYATSEEIFWRSYMLDALRPTGKMGYSMVIGILWWGWHFRFSTAFDFTGFLIICVFSTFLLCQFAEETKSYLSAAGLHSLIIITTSDGEMTRSKITGMVLSILLWLAIGKFWKGKVTVPLKNNHNV
jgi:hypothetical protein